MFTVEDIDGVLSQLNPDTRNPRNEQGSCRYQMEVDGKICRCLAGEIIFRLCGQEDVDQLQELSMIQNHKHKVFYARFDERAQQYLMWLQAGADDRRWNWGEGITWARERMGDLYAA